MGLSSPYGLWAVSCFCKQQIIKLADREGCLGAAVLIEYDSLPRVSHIEEKVNPPERWYCIPIAIGRKSRWLPFLLKEAAQKPVIVNEVEQSQKSDYSLSKDCYGRSSLAMTKIELLRQPLFVLFIYLYFISPGSAYSYPA